MLAVLRRVAEVRREQRQADSSGRQAQQDLHFTVSPLGRLSELQGVRVGSTFQAVFSVLFSVVVHLSLAVLIVSLPIGWIEYQDPPREYRFAMTEEEPPLVLDPVFELARPDNEWREHENVLESLSRSAALEFNPKTPLERVIVPITREGDFKVLEPIQPIAGTLFTQGVPHKGTIGEQMVHVEGAVDRITYEIARNLEEKNVIVIWLMDASLSLVKERQEVARHLERVFKEIDQLKLVENDELVGAVIAYGQQIKVLQDPTEDTAKVLSAIRSVPDDETGVENVFAAMQFAIDRYATRVTHQRRRMMIINWTDESGDDYRLLDGVIASCQRLSIPVYSVGPSAMFGKEHGLRPYVHPEDGQTYFLPVCRGPDSVHQEQLELPFWFDGSQYRNLHSGLGPFALTRLSYESGGAYFIKDDPQEVAEFQVPTMVRYAPEYDSIAHYIRRVQNSPLRRAIMQVVEMSKQRTIKANPTLQLAPTANTFQQELLEAQKTAAFNLDVVDQLLVPFGQGFEKDYTEEKSARWRAWYDYTYGRLLAMRVRNYEYNVVCSVFKGKGREFVDQKSNRWKFVPDANISSSTSQKQAAEATRLLRRCIDGNPGTPWAVLAQRELKDPLGFKVEEAYEAPPPPPPKPKAGPAPKVVVPKIVPQPPPAKQAIPQPNMLPRPKEVKLPKL
jgi:hypothetical protein